MRPVLVAGVTTATLSGGETTGSGRASAGPEPHTPASVSPPLHEGEQENGDRISPLQPEPPAPVSPSPSGLHSDLKP